MPPETSDSDTARLWIEYAVADLAIAKAPLPPLAKYELLLFHAQQAVEKAIKGVLVKHNIDFHHTHNIQRLIELLPMNYANLPFVLTATALTEYAVAARYPGSAAPVDQARFQRLLQIAEVVVDWAKTVIGE